MCRFGHLLLKFNVTMNLLIILLSIVFGFLLFLTVNYVLDVLYSPSYKAANRIPGKRIYPVIGNLPAIALLDRGKYRKKKSTIQLLLC
jgi:hypothetical protein